MQGGIDWWYREASLNKFEKYYVYHKRYTIVESFGSFTEVQDSEHARRRLLRPRLPALICVIARLFTSDSINEASVWES